MESSCCHRSATRWRRVPGRQGSGGSQLGRRRGISAFGLGGEAQGERCAVAGRRFDRTCPRVFLRWNRRWRGPGRYPSSWSRNKVEFVWMPWPESAIASRDNGRARARTGARAHCLVAQVIRMIPLLADGVENEVLNSPARSVRSTLALQSLSGRSVATGVAGVPWRTDLAVSRTMPDRETAAAAPDCPLWQTQESCWARFAGADGAPVFAQAFADRAMAFSSSMARVSPITIVRGHFAQIVGMPASTPGFEPGGALHLGQLRLTLELRGAICAVCFRTRRRAR